METPKEQRPAGSSRTTCSALVRRCNVCNVINAVDLDATPERWAEMQRKDHTVWHVDEATAIKLWDEEGGKCDHAKLIAELRAKLSLPNVKEHAPPPAAARSETGGEVQTTQDSADKAAGGGCRDSSCSASSSLASGGDLAKLVRKGFSVAVMFLTSYAGINVGVAYGGGGEDGVLDLCPMIVEVGTAQSELSHNLRDRLIEGGSRGHGSVCPIGVDQPASPSRDDSAKLSTPDLGFPIKDGFLRGNVPLLSEVMSQDRANHNPDQSPKHVCPWCEGRQVGIVNRIGYHVFVVLAAMGIGLPVVYWLVQKNFFLPNAIAVAPPTQDSNEETK